ncbi:hypothetical protein [Plastoroseomonas arctica]|uniref:Lipoprotein n=1 Tax=Plastoroseomonas arctica TaxID=1509237 RepID=A0AAF1K065_9PROT|nr:hypothetical protein [Plastoroseomonas arctica]MBR0654738.1 hypothetical protein [Plastoroseomonas arctica]
MRGAIGAGMLMLAMAGCGGGPPGAPPPAAPAGTPPQQAAALFFSLCAEPDPTKTHAEATRQGLRRPSDIPLREVLHGRAGDVFAVGAARDSMLMLGETPRQCEIWVNEVAPRDIDPEFSAGLARLREAGATTSLVNQAESAGGLTKTYLVITPDRVARLFAFGPNRQDPGTFRSVLTSTNDPARIADARLQAR